MTISSETRKAGPFAGNDVTTVFPFTFKVFSEDDLEVVRADLVGAETTLVLDTDYTVSLNPSQNTDPGGSITLSAALATGYAMVITTALQSLQTADLTNNGGFFPQIITNALDRLTILLQQLNDRVSRSLKVGITTPAGVSAELPAPAADTLLGWNSAGDAITNFPTNTSLLGTSLAGSGGSTLVGDDDGASGSLWTTVRGFITYLRSSLGSSIVGFLQSGTGAVARTAQDKMREISVDVNDFGTTGNSTTGDDVVFQLAIDYLHKISDDTGVQGILEFDGTIYLAAPINFGKNIILRGKGRNFRSTIKPLASFVGGYLFSFDGSLCIGGWAFRITHEDFVVDCSLIVDKTQLPMVYKVNKCYDYQIDVWIYNAVGTGIQIESSNWGTLVKPSIYGRTASIAVSEYGILLKGDTGAEGGVKIISPDIELFYKGIRQEANARVDIISPYLERNIVGWEAAGNSTGYVTVTGGQSASPGASGTAAQIQGENVTVVGGIYEANGGSGLVVVAGAGRKNNVRLYNVVGDVSDARNYSLRDMDSTRWYLGKARSQKDVTDNTATTFFNITTPFLSTHFAVVDVAVNARDASGYSMWTAKYRFTVSNPDGTLRVTPVVEYAKTNVNISANYTLTLTAATSVAGTTCAFQITADVGGALGNGTTPRISAEAEIVQWDSAGGVYLAAA